jgi:aspartyl/asparaginyl-tRNA synthetase
MEKFIEILKPNEQEDNQLIPNKEIVVFGMIHNIRITKWGGFLILRKSKGLLQAVFNSSKASILNEKGEPLSFNDLSRETAIKVIGIVNSANIKDISVFYRNIEIEINKIEVLSTPNTKDVIDINSIYFDTESYFPFKLDNRHITLRNIKSFAIFKISSQITKAFVDYLNSNGFTQIFSPKLVSAGAEGGANIFELDYFGKKAYLAQSPQFYKQICVGVFERVFEIAPVYRAEKHSTSRHLNEYISIDLEMGFINDHTDVMLLEASLLKYVLSHIEENCQYELGILNATLPLLPDKIPVYRLSEVHEILHNHYKDRLSQDHRGEPDLAPEEEVLLCEYTAKEFMSDFVFVTHFPKRHRAFYSMDDPQNSDLTLSFDLLMKGREITSGSQRIHTEEQYISKMKELGMNLDNFGFYLETFRNGMPPHGGLAIGLERLTSGILNIHNVKEASLFPRDINRLTP